MKFTEVSNYTLTAIAPVLGFSNHEIYKGLKRY